MKTIKFELSLDEANLVLAALGKLPYESSFGLIEKLKTQATPQLQPKPELEVAEVVA